MSDRTRLFLTGVAAVAAVGLTVGAPRVFHIAIGDDDDEVHAAPLSSLQDFDGITLNGPDDVEITRGENFSVSYSGDRDAIRHMNSFVRDGVLHISRRRQEGWSGLRGSQVKVHVNMPDLRRVTITGSGDVDVSKVEGMDFRVLISGSGSLNVDELESEMVAVTMRGSGDVSLAGKTGRLETNTFGSGDMDLGALEADTAEIRITGSGTVDARARRSAQLNVTGSGDAHVKGTDRCEISKVGSGEAECEA